MTSAIETFRPSWSHSRGLTLDFIEAVPAERWGWSPHPRYAALSKQFRHMIRVQDVYEESSASGLGVSGVISLFLTTPS